MRSKIIASLLVVACLPMPAAGAYQAYLEEVPQAWTALRDGLRSDFPQIDFAEYDRLSDGAREVWPAVNRPVIDTAPWS